MTDFLSRVRSFGRAHGLWEAGGTILAAVSGGPDSLALLLALESISKEEKFRLAACVVDHHLREESGSEADFVETVCRERGIPCARKDVFVEEERNLRGGSVETVARELRYAALREAARDFGADRIAAAHHRDDQAETVLYRLLRGSGGDGLSGMRARAGDIIRPFLCVTRADIETFLEAFPYTPCHDASNEVPDTVRNSIRLALIPVLRGYNPNISETLCRTAEILESESAYLEEETEKYRPLFSEEGDSLVLLRAALRDVPAVLRRRLLRRVWTHFGLRAPDYEALCRIETFIEEKPSGKWTSAGGVIAEIVKKDIRFRKGSTRAGRAEIK